MGTTLNERLRQARINAGFEKASDFAKAVGVQEGTYRHHENGTGGRSVPLSAAKKYAAKLGIDLNWLLNGDGPDAAPLTAEDRELLARFKALPPAKRKSFLDILPEAPASQPDQPPADDQE
ncbi:MAG TPA: helix-turn-helix transcriptional regulator [Sphingomonadaceae bacterium]|nr:helix-turn-helix transcriptional regulator [Sphingomonadaceae bacterium]